MALHPCHRTSTWHLGKRKLELLLEMLFCREINVFQGTPQINMMSSACTFKKKIIRKEK
jgi:hypothetical protein